MHPRRRRRTLATRSPDAPTRTPAGTRSAPAAPKARQLAAMTSPAPRSRRRPYREDSSARCARRRLCVGHRIPYRGNEAAFVEKVDVAGLARCGGHHVLSLRNRACEPGPVDLDDQLMMLDVKGKTAPVAEMAEAAGMQARGNIFQGKPFVGRITTRREAHDRTLPRRVACLHLLFDCRPLRTHESYPLLSRIKHA